MKRMGWGEEENSAFIWDRHKAWGRDRRRKGVSVPKDEEIQARNTSSPPLPGLSLCKIARSGGFHLVGPRLPLSWR